jgi:hypothetical protein
MICGGLLDLRDERPSRNVGDSIMSISKRRIVTVGVLVAQALWGGPAGAAGAIAVGVAPGGAQRGFSFAMNADRTTEADARQDALSGCRKSKESNDRARARCTVAGTFTNQCGSVAMDPKDGTPGVGWAIAPDSAAAERQALASCEGTAGPGRAGSCKVSATRCDGTAK